MDDTQHVWGVIVERVLIGILFLLALVAWVADVVYFVVAPVGGVVFLFVAGAITAAAVTTWRGREQ